jgi:RNA polymerase sigma-70 factor (ECF subfamily)
VHEPLPSEDPSDLKLRDVALMQLCARRDPSAQRAVALRLVGRVRRLSRLLMREPVEAEDAAQLALLEILQSASGFRRAGSLEAWADRITARTTLRLAREIRARSSIFQRVADVDSLLDVFPGLSARPHSGSNLDTFLTRLSPRRREAFVLKYAVGYSFEEIVELTGAPLGTVKDRIAIARKQLRGMIEREAARASRGEQR